jgi:hypothetical protein
MCPMSCSECIVDISIGQPREFVCKSRVVPLLTEFEAEVLEQNHG